MACTLCACAAPPRRGQPEGSEQAHAQPVRARAPLWSTLSGPVAPLPAQPFELTAVVARRAPIAQQIRVVLKLPAGVTLVEGEAARWLAPNAHAQRDTLTFRVRAETMPSDDARLEVSFQGAGSGYHAEHVYRFGRAPELAQEPQRSPERLQIGAHELGRPVDMRP